MTFDAKVYLDKLSMHGGSKELTPQESAAVWAELDRRMGKEPEPKQEVPSGTPQT